MHIRGSRKRSYANVLLGLVPLALATLGAALDGDTLLAPVSFWVGFWLGLGVEQSVEGDITAIRPGLGQLCV